VGVLAVQVLTCVAEHHRVPCLDGDVLHGGNQCGEEGVLQVGDDQCPGVRALAPQGATVRVTNVVGRDRRFPHAVGQFGSHGGGPVQHSGDSCCRNARRLGHVGHSRRTVLIHSRCPFSCHFP